MLWGRGWPARKSKPVERPNGTNSTNRANRATPRAVQDAPTRSCHPSLDFQSETHSRGKWLDIGFRHFQWVKIKVLRRLMGPLSVSSVDTKIAC